MLDELVIPGQASVLNGVGKIYTPRYRQATFFSFLSPKKDGAKALDVAYEDVANAFDYFIKHFNSDRPFFILSHSQGTCHAIRLLAEKIESTPLVKKLVAAYCIGYRFPEELFSSIFKNLKPGFSPEANGVVIAWDTYVEGGIPAQKTDWCPVSIPQSDGTFQWARRSGKKPLCINPISFASDQAEKAKQDHKGGSRAIPDKAMPSDITKVFGAEPLGNKADHLSEIEEAMISARVDKSGFLFISKPANSSFRRKLLPLGNYHNYDIALFYEDIRANAALRWSFYATDKA
ncbi:MAG: hypothetical protein ACI959_001633 [Limisphaerales bacterium]|jgi:hypothetical protein